MKSKLLFFLAFSLLLTACSVIPASAPAPKQNAPMLNTPSGQVGNSNPQATQSSNGSTSSASSPETFSNSPNISSYLDNRFYADACMDLDTVQLVTDASCDVWLSDDGGLLITPQNGALFSGYGNLTMFSEAECVANQFSADPISLMTGLYMCFLTNQGSYGVFVLREDPNDGNITYARVDVHLFISQTPSNDASQDQSQPVPAQPTDTPTPAPSIQTRSNYVELRDSYATNDTADMDFSGLTELAYIAPTSDYPDHGLGQNVNQGEGIMMALVPSATYDICRAIPAWNQGIAPVHAGETYCYLTANGTYGYFHIDKIENRGSEIDAWIIGLSYTIWLP